jgi:hypothetical protein
MKTAAILRSRAFLAIASGYLFAACIVIPWMLTFPGVFTPGGLLGAGSTNSLYVQWHAGLPGFVIWPSDCGGVPWVQPSFRVLPQRDALCPTSCSTRFIFPAAGFMLAAV